MENQNRNNRVYTGQQSGKTDRSIESLLRRGKENAVSTADLVRLSGCKDARTLRERIAEERRSGAIICSGAGAGYWLPKDKEEIKEFCKTMENRAKNILSVIRSARKALDLPDGQEEMTDLPEE